MDHLKEFSSLPFSDRAKLPRTSGVYVVTDSEHVLYVGQSKNLQRRWQGKSHHHTAKISEYKGAVIHWREYSTDELETQESELINALSPLFNRGAIPAHDPMDEAEAQKRGLVYVVNSRTSKGYWLNAELANAPGYWLPSDPTELTREDAIAVFGDPDIAARELVRLLRSVALKNAASPADPCTRKGE